MPYLAVLTFMVAGPCAWPGLLKARFGHSAVVNFLLDEGAEVNQCDCQHPNCTFGVAGICKVGYGYLIWLDILVKAMALLHF